MLPEPESISLSAVTTLLAPHSMASIKAWLKFKGTSYSASGKAALAERVHGLLKKDKISEQELRETLIGIEESGSKRVFLFQVDNPSKIAANLEKNLTSLQVSADVSRVPAQQNPSKTTIVYAINGKNDLRIKWVETHRSYSTDVDTLTVIPEKNTKIVVAIFNKTTGLVQLRYDKPEARHPHKTNGAYSADVYYSYFREQMENYLGEKLKPIDLRPALTKLVNATPRLVEVGSNDCLTEEGMTVKITSRKRGRDVRDAKDWNAMDKHGAKERSHEIESLHWLVEPSQKALTREVFTFIDGRKGFMRFLADCLEMEIEYALAHTI